MRVLVTGGSGRLGRAVLRELADHGHPAVNADRFPPGEDLGAEFFETDLTDMSQVSEALHGCDALVHLGAIPTLGTHPDEVVFANNTQATFTVLQAAESSGVVRVGIASSIAIYGDAYATNPSGPLYLPVDEAHPLRVRDAYGLSKEVDERVAAMFCRRSSMSVAALRFHWVGAVEERDSERFGDRLDPEGLAPLLWGYVDVRDAAAACRLAIETDDLGFEAFNITAADTLFTMPTGELIRRYLPETQMRHPMPGRSSAISIDKAERLLSWRPQHSWAV